MARLRSLYTRRARRLPHRNVRRVRLRVKHNNHSRRYRKFTRLRSRRPRRGAFRSRAGARRKTKLVKRSHNYKPHLQQSIGWTSKKDESKQQFEGIGINQKEPLKFRSSYGLTHLPGTFAQFWYSSLTKMPMADQTNIDPSYVTHGIRTAPVVIGLGASVRAEVTIYPYTSWCVRMMIFTCSHQKEAFLDADNLLDLDVTWETDQVGNKYLNPEVHTFVPDACGPPFWPFTKAHSLGLDNAQDLMRLGTPTAARCFLLKSQVWTLKNKSTVKKRQSLNIFRKLYHYTEYHKAIVNGQVTLVPYEAYHPINVMIIAYPLSDDGEMPIRLPPILRPDPRLFHQREGKFERGRRQGSVEPDLAGMQAELLDMSPEGHEVTLDLQMAEIQYKYDLEALQELEKWKEDPAHENDDEVDDGGWLRHLDDQRLHVKKLEEDVVIKKKRLEAYRISVGRRWDHAARNDQEKVTLEPGYRYLRTPRLTRDNRPDYSATAQEDLGSMSRQDTQTWADCQEEHGSPDDGETEKETSRHVRLIKQAHAKYQGFVFQGMDMNVTTRYWFRNVRKTLGMPFN